MLNVSRKELFTKRFQLWKQRSAGPAALKERGLFRESFWKWKEVWHVQKHFLETVWEYLFPNGHLTVHKGFFVSIVLSALQYYFERMFLFLYCKVGLDRFSLLIW